MSSSTFWGGKVTQIFVSSSTADIARTLAVVCAGHKPRPPAFRLLHVSLDLHDLHGAVAEFGRDADLLADLVADEGLGERALVAHDALVRIAVPHAENRVDVEAAIGRFLERDDRSEGNLAHVGVGEISSAGQREFAFGLRAAAS